MNNFEKRFQDYFKTKFILLPSGKWMYNEGLKETFSCKKNSPVKEFKIKYPEKYKEIMDNWFDEIHPY